MCVPECADDCALQHKRTGTAFGFRIASEAVTFLAPLMTKRKFDVGLEGVHTQRVCRCLNVRILLRVVTRSL